MGLFYPPADSGSKSTRLASGTVRVKVMVRTTVVRARGHVLPVGYEDVGSETKERGDGE